MRRLGLALAAILALAPGVSRALAIVEVRPERTQVEIGDTVRVDLYVDATRPIVGWGLDLGIDPASLEPLGAPAIGPLWAPVAAADGDGLAGLRSTPSPAGNDLLLGSVTLRASRFGLALLFADITAGDLTEGFALDPIGFDTVTLGTATIDVIPEPASGALLALGLAAAWIARGRRSRDC